MEESDEAVASQFLSLEVRLWQGGFTGSWSEQQSDFSRVQSQKTHATDVKPAKTRRNAKPHDCATPFEIHNHLSTPQQSNWLAGQTRSDLNCQISLAQLCMPSPTVEQIRRATAWVRRTHQFKDLTLTFFEHSSRETRFVTQTDYSSKDPGGTGRTQGGYSIAATDPSMGAGNMAP